MAAKKAQENYYDILLLGRTGRGKSTLGNKLLQCDTHKDSKSLFKIQTKPYSTKKKFTAESEVIEIKKPFERFATTDDIPNSQEEKKIESVTKVCEVAVNTSTAVRVVDTPGFADTNALSEVASTVYLANLHIFRWIAHIRVQLEKHNKLKVRRVVYFLPDRGVPEKADGILREEIKVMYHYYGKFVFDCMVIVATQQQRYRDVIFTKEDSETVRTTFKYAVSQVTKIDIDCPPVVYIAFDDKEDVVLSKIQTAKVLVNEEFTLNFADGTCLRCSSKTRYVQSPSGPLQKIGILHGNDDSLVKYDESKCHPRFYARSGGNERLLGSLAHGVTLGIPYLVLNKGLRMETWSGLYDIVEICPVCKKLPGAVGCCQVMTQVKIGTEVVVVDHTDKLDEL